MIVSVYDGEQLLDRRECRETRLPDGRAAAIWRGLVFPLRPGGDAIDVGDQADTPSAASPPADQAGGAFALIEGQDEAYVLVAGSAMVSETAAAALRRAGIEVLRTGRYLGDTVDGLNADWFIRIVRPAGEFAPLQTAVSTALGEMPLSPKPTGAALRAELLIDELAASRTRTVADLAEIERLRLALAERTSSTEEAETLRATIEAERRQREITEANMRDLLADLRPLPSVEPGPTLPPAAPRIAARMHREIEAVLAALLPRIRLLRNSLDVIAVEYTDRRDLYRVLADLERCEGGVPPRWKTTQAVEGVIQKSHVGNGQDNQGRVYARRTQASWSVLVSHKADQSRDIAWLKSH